MTTDWRALCVDLVAWADYTSAHYYAPPEVLVRAHAALAQPEPEGPTDEEIMGLMPQQMRDDLAAAARALAGFDPDNIKAASVFRIILNRHSVDLARAVLARWGTPNLTETRSSLKDAWAAHQPAIEAAAKAGMEACRMDGPAVPDGREPASVIEKPSDGEVAELVAALRNDAINCTCSTLTSGNLRRAADLLEQRQAAPVPVPVSERLPEAELCWWYEPDEDDDGSGYGGSWTLLRIRGSTVTYTHWLPASALPIPTTETQP